MRYLVHRETGKVTAVDENDDQRFYDLARERDGEGREVYEQTGAQDPRVEEVAVPGQDPPNGESRSPLAPGASGEAVPGDAAVPRSPAQTLIKGTQTPEPAKPAAK